MTGLTIPSISCTIGVAFSYRAREKTMHKAERDNALTRLSPAEREHFRRLIQDMRTQVTASSGHRSPARQVLAA